MLKGIDISKWQNTAAVDQGQDFVIIKATEGVGYVDPTCDAKYQYAKSKGKLLGVYHFARPDLTGAVAEADYFVDNTVGYWKNKEAILVLDWEAGNTKNVAWAKQWLDHVHSRTGVKPLIYMSASVVSSADWTSVKNDDYGLWIAGYPNKYNVTNPPVPAEGEMPYNTSPWGFAAIWQYTSSAGTLDRNVAYMTKEAWGKYAGKVSAPPAPPKPVITTKDETKTETIPFEITRRPDVDRLVGDEIVIEDGVNGSRVIVTRITYTDGKETKREVITDKTTAPKNKVVFYGTKEPEQPEEELPHENNEKPSEPTNTHLNALASFILDQLTKLLAKKDEIIAWVKSLFNKLEK